MNNVQIMGRISTNPELRYLQAGNNTAVARFSVTVDKNLSREKRQEMESRNQPTADFINIVAWGKLGENVAKFAGRIETKSYEKDGQRVYTTDINASNIEFLDWIDSNNNQVQQNNQNQNNSYGYNEDFAQVNDKRIPF